MTAVSYDTRTRTRKTSYADGTETVIVYDACGNILSATNESGTLSYTYNKAGKLIKQTDGKTGETVNYTYDKAGRKSSLSSDKRKIFYIYGKNGEIISVKDTLQNLAVSYTYDKCGRETERHFANGVVQKTRYDKAGRAVSIAQYAKNGNLLSGEAYVYDETGRRSYTVNEKGLVTIYKYDNQSRLQTVFYPFNEDIKETARKEADKQGLYFLPSQGNPENYFLSSSEMIKLRAATENLSRARGNSITVNQVVWKESYTYDANGNRTSKTTAWGTISYSYDKENRLTESGELGKSESVKYTYDKNGNLLKENSPRYRKEFEYNAQNRMSLSHVQDFVEDTRNIAEYDYDAFGRRVETYQYLGDYTRNLYDGFSFDIVGKSVLQSAYSANLSDQKYRTPNRQPNHHETSTGGRNNRGTDIGTRYRYIDENLPVSTPGTADNTIASTSLTKTRSRPNNEYVLYSYGEPVAMTNDNSTSYFGTDILGSVRSVTNKYGAVQADYNYDVFGSPYLYNLENDIDFGYCGKVYDVGTGLYDYGFRDYSHFSARFTTVDPIRDGSNWFSYVVNDPVNYIDPLGLTATDSGNKSILTDLWSNTKKWWADTKTEFTQSWNTIKQLGKETFNKIIQFGKTIKQGFFKAIVFVGVNLFGGESTKKIYNAALNREFQGLPTLNGDDYGVSEGLKNEAGNTYLLDEGAYEGKDLIQFLQETVGNRNYNEEGYSVDVRKTPGFSDMETAIGKYRVTILDISEMNGITTVTIHAHDVFNFESQIENNGRPGFNEFVTGLAREAGLGSDSTTIDVTFELKFRKEGNNYVYAE